MAICLSVDPGRTPLLFKAEHTLRVIGRSLRSATCPANQFDNKCYGDGGVHWFTARCIGASRTPEYVLLLYMYCINMYKYV